MFVDTHNTTQRYLLNFGLEQKVKQNQAVYCLMISQSKKYQKQIIQTLQQVQT